MELIKSLIDKLETLRLEHEQELCDCDDYVEINQGTSTLSEENTMDILSMLSDVNNALNDHPSKRYDAMCQIRAGLAVLEERKQKPEYTVEFKDGFIVIETSFWRTTTIWYSYDYQTDEIFKFSMFSISNTKGDKVIKDIHKDFPKG